MHLTDQAETSPCAQGWFPQNQATGGFEQMMKAGFGLCVAAFAMAGITGCATKNYVKKQTAPLIDHTNQLDEKTATNNRNLHDVDDRAQTGIKQAQGAADTANQNAQNATKAAGDAETAANDAVHRADSLDAV